MRILGFSFEALEFCSGCMDQSTSGLANMNIPRPKIENPMTITIVAPHSSLDLLSIPALKIFSVHVIFNIIKIKRESILKIIIYCTSIGYVEYKQ